MLPVPLPEALDARCDIVLEPGRARARGHSAMPWQNDGWWDELQRKRVPYPEQARDLAAYAVLAESLRGRIERVAASEEGMVAVLIEKGEVARTVSGDFGQEESSRPRNVVSPACGVQA